MKKTTYQAQFKDPRWQKKRLEILNRDNFTCQMCDDETGTLHVHHKLYERGKQVWEYENEALITLCEECHIIEHDGILYAKEMATQLISDLMVKGFQSNTIAYFFESLIMANNDAACISEELKDLLNKGLDFNEKFAKEMTKEAKIAGNLNLRL